MTVTAEGPSATTDSPASQQTLSTVDLNALADSVEAQEDGKYVQFTKGQVNVPLNHPTCHMSSHAVTRAPSGGFCCKKQTQLAMAGSHCMHSIGCTHMSLICTQVAGLIIGLWLGLLLVVTFIAAIVLLALEVRHNLTLLHMNPTVLA